MTQFDMYTIETAPEGSKKILEGETAKYKFLPNLLGKMAESPLRWKPIPPWQVFSIKLIYLPPNVR